jgi:hypothetical protein
MIADKSSPDGRKNVISRADYFFVSLWTLGILLLYAIGGSSGARLLQGYKAEAAKMRQALIEAATTDLEAAAPEIKVVPGSEPVEVSVGIHVNRIEEFSMRESSWTADLDIWFRWIGDAVNPGEHFHIVNGDISFREREEALAEGSEHYERYHVKARLAAHFDQVRFPFGNQAAIIQVEDRAQGAEILRYIPDERDSGFSGPGIPASLKIIRTLAAVNRHGYQTSRGDPRVPEGEADIHSRFVFAMVLAPPGGSLFIKLFQALFASVAIALVAFFIKPIHVDPRFGLGVGAFFAAVGNNIYIGSILPYTSRVGLPELVNAVGLGTIFLTLVQSTISLYIFDSLGREKLRRLFDHVSFVVFLAGVIGLNLIFVLLASS